jgi:hypothetical protein
MTLTCPKGHLNDAPTKPFCGVGGCDERLSRVAAGPRFCYGRYSVQERLVDDAYSIGWRVRDLASTGGEREFVLREFCLGGTLATVLAAGAKRAFVDRARLPDVADCLPGLPKIHSVFTCEAWFYTVEDKPPGETLESRLKGGALNPSDVLPILRGFLASLAVIHERGLFHGGLSALMPPSSGKALLPPPSALVYLSYSGAPDAGGSQPNLAADRPPVVTLDRPVHLASAASPAALGSKQWGDLQAAADIMAKSMGFKDAASASAGLSLPILRIAFVEMGKADATARKVLERITEPPIIESFKAAPETIQCGGSSTLRWNVKGATVKVLIDPGIESVDSVGAYQVTPTVTTTYTLTAAGQGGNAVQSLTVTVTPPPPPPVIEFKADPAVIPFGESSTLRWRVKGDTAKISIDQGIGVAPLVGDRKVTPKATTTYSLSAEGPGGTATATVTVTVTEPPPAIELFKAKPASIRPGQSSTLRWRVKGAASVVSIDHGVGPVPASGERAASPAVKTTYRLEASGPGGKVSASATVNVRPKLPRILWLLVVLGGLVIGAGIAGALRYYAYRDFCDSLDSRNLDEAKSSYNAAWPIEQDWYRTKALGVLNGICAEIQPGWEPDPKLPELCRWRADLDDSPENQNVADYADGRVKLARFEFPASEKVAAAMWAQAPDNNLAQDLIRRIVDASLLKVSDPEQRRNQIAQVRGFINQLPFPDNDFLIRMRSLLPAP